MPGAGGNAERRDAAVALLRELGAGETEHLDGSLLTHLESTEAILRGWGAPETVALAGLCHAFYGTDGFPPSLLDLDERGRLAAAAGDDVEAIVYRYASCDRSATYAALGPPTVAFTDRFRGVTGPLDAAGMEEFALLTVANELELARRGIFDAALVGRIGELFDALAPYTPHAAPAAAELRARG